MPREPKAYLKDVLDAIGNIETYTEAMTFEDFRENRLVQDGVVRNLEIIGEAVKSISDDIKTTNPDIEWKKIAGLRDILIHAYFGIDVEIVWDVVENKLTGLKEGITKILSNIG